MLLSAFKVIRQQDFERIYHISPARAKAQRVSRWPLTM
jgi:hypothetical protein